MKTVALLSVIFILAGCEPEWQDPYEMFIIPKGKHSKSLDIQFLQNSELEFYAIFNATARYTSELAENQWDINKLLGFADCNSHHHQNSARFGWRWLNDSLEIMAYCYVDGERIAQKVGTLELNQPGYFRIEINESKYAFTLNDNPVVELPRKATCEKGAYYMLWPYFGGDEVAPHDIEIKLKLEN